jgi:hypothetical protein
LSINCNESDDTEAVFTAALSKSIQTFGVAEHALVVMVIGCLQLLMMVVLVLQKKV